MVLVVPPLDAPGQLREGFHLVEGVSAEIVSLGIVPAVEDWKKENPNL